MFVRRSVSVVLGLVPAIALSGCDQIDAIFSSSDSEEAQVQARSFAQRASPSERLDEAAVEEAFMVEAPETGLDLGWGWSLSRGQVIPTECVIFTRRNDPAQETTVSIEEVRDSQSLSKAMDISSSVSVKTIGYSASGKAKFAKNTKVTSFSTTYTIRAEVRNGAIYAGPIDPQRGHLGAAVVLTDAAAALAQRDLESFQEACGEGFISAKMTGAEAFAVIDIQTRSKSEKESVKASVQGSGWGVKVNAAFAATSATGRDTSNTNISFYQAGGSGNSLPKDKDEILARITDLAQDALDAPKTYALEITPYQVLENFPRGEALTAEAGETDEIAAAWGLYRTVFDDIGTVFADPTDFNYPVADCTDVQTVRGCTISFQPINGDLLNSDDGPGGVTTLELLGVLQDVALRSLDRIELGAQNCLESDENCAFDPAALRSSYAVRANMPLPGGWLEGTPGQAELRAAHTAFHLREAARGRCGISSLEVGCISNAEIDAWSDRLGFVPLAAPDRDAFDQATAVMDGQGPYLTGDPDRPDALTLWVPPAQFESVQQALKGTDQVASR